MNDCDLLACGQRWIVDVDGQDGDDVDDVQ